MVRRALLVLVLLACAGLVSAQSAQPAPYTEIEALRVENVRLEGQLIQRAIQDYQAKVTRLKADLEKGRTGFIWNPETGGWSAAK
jgi:hypothetical protein